MHLDINFTDPILDYNDLHRTFVSGVTQLNLWCLEISSGTIKLL
jgi:hypothetical protein